MSPTITLIKYLCLLISICLVVFIIDAAGFLSPIRAPLTSIMLGPMQRMAGVRADGQALVLFLPKSFEAAKREQALNAKLNTLLSQSTQNILLQKQNESLQKALDANLQQAKPAIATLYQSENHAVIITADSRPIANGAFVVQQKNLVGQVSGKIGKGLYEVILTTNPAFIAKSRIVHDSTMIDGIAQGQFGTTIHVTKILVSATIGPNDVVVVHDEEKGLANDFLLGKIAKVARNETAVFQEAQVVPVADLAADPTVFVLFQ